MVSLQWGTSPNRHTLDLCALVADFLGSKVLNFCNFRFCWTTCPDLLIHYPVVVQPQHTKQTDPQHYSNLTYLGKCNFPLTSVVKKCSTTHINIFVMCQVSPKEQCRILFVELALLISYRVSHKRPSLNKQFMIFKSCKSLIN